MMFTQLTPEDVADTIRKATEHSWESGLLAVMMIAAMVALVWLVRTWLNQAAAREKEMGLRITALEEFNRTELRNVATQGHAAIERNTAALDKLNDVLEARPCFWSKEKQAEILRVYSVSSPPK